VKAAARKTIVLTGVTRGLGRALLERFAAEGHRVLGCGRDAERIAELIARYGSSHDLAAVDVSDRLRVEAWANRLLAAHGAPDLLINNAALINRNAPLWEVPAAEFDRVVDVNIKGVANLIRAFLPAMLARGAGVIANLSSGWGRSTSPQVAPYCATKYAVEGLTQALAQELPAGLAAVAVSPGVVDTDMLRSSGGGGAGSAPSPVEWAARAAPFFLALSRKDNGKSLTIR
jgi:NAD(P)-dependent dehydrogenase (short-subunit alcohol dehydrogenase family)